MSSHDDTLKSIALEADGARLVLLNFGATTCDWRVPAGSRSVPMILGFDDLTQYVTSPFYFGAIVGRVSNRIGEGGYDGPEGRVELDCNEGTSVLHGGAKGLSTAFWTLEAVSANEAIMTYTSPDGENGFPGKVQFDLHVILSATELRYVMRAKVDRPTPISMAQHNYYNLGATPDIWGYHLTCASHQTLAKNAHGVATGQVLDIAGSPLDFRETAPLSTVQERGLDDHFLFTTPGGSLREVAEIRSANGLGIKVRSDQHGAQVYTANGMAAMTGGLDGKSYGSASGVCFEPQGHPNAVNISSFPSVMVTPDHPYEQTLVIKAVGLDA